MGIFTKLTIVVGQQTQSQRQTLLKLVNVASQNVTYFDTEKGALNTESFYFGDVEDILKLQYGMNHEAVTITIIGNDPRS